MMRPVCCPQNVNKILQTYTTHNPLKVKTGIKSQIKLHCTTLILPIKTGDFALFLNDISKYSFSFSLSCTIHLGNELSCLLNLRM